MGKLKNNGGFSLVETLVAIVILGLITVPVLSGMTVAIRAMNYSEQMIQSQLAVSSAVETLMAEGIKEANLAGDVYSLSGHTDVTITAKQAQEGSTDLPYYNVKVTSGSYTVETVIREEGGEA